MLDKRLRKWYVLISLGLVAVIVSAKSYVFDGTANWLFRTGMVLATFGAVACFATLCWNRAHDDEDGGMFQMMDRGFVGLVVLTGAALIISLWLTPVLLAFAVLLVITIFVGYFVSPIPKRSELEEYLEREHDL